jgi:hypothetical protein
MGTRAASVDSPVAGVTALDPVAVLDARELRLLAFATGEHLPIELQHELCELAARRAAMSSA